MLRFQFDNVAFFFGNHGEIKFSKERALADYIRSTRAFSVKLSGQHQREMKF